MSKDTKAWLIYFDDADIKPEVFTGEGAGEFAQKRYESLCQHWSVTLFYSAAVVSMAIEISVDSAMRILGSRGNG